MAKKTNSKTKQKNPRFGLQSKSISLSKKDRSNKDTGLKMTVELKNKKQIW